MYMIVYTCITKYFLSDAWHDSICTCIKNFFLSDAWHMTPMPFIQVKDKVSIQEEIITA